ncbi:hypothetical protein HF888_07945 [Bermanella marisrubri]|uniref:TolR n=1 Tax=Bermanella marisrubri TaxID=207949 RepID=Q1N4L6_9GAMM|nr:MotA/TolQ/ExbB proton channel family protein [Bermanella marisrubri]EAT13412.1 TolR [Oceanobacter sp. RED65] [Bermanella marisrubri]QIZ84162.1 hypothetical protein HF888_07945 [Bermanella marisrubri]
MIKVVRYLVVGLALLSLNINADEVQENKPKNIASLEALLQAVKQDGLRQQEVNQQRERRFLENRNEQRTALRQAKAKLEQVRQETKTLKSQFDSNEGELAELEQELKQRLGNLGEMFGVVRQVSQDVAAIRENSIVAVEIGQNDPVLERLATSKALPDIPELESLWYQLQLHITKQSEAKIISADYVDAQGVKQTGSVAHVGPFIALNENGFLSFDAETGLLLELGKQPSGASTAIDYFAGDAEESVIDPTRGTLLQLGSQSPNVLERVNQGGYIGYVILALAFSGILYAAYLLLLRIQIKSRVDAQLANTDEVRDDNPLGRVLSVYQQHKDESDLESLEMTLDEAVLKELPELERGLSLIKLLAAVAPLLGLLGTVTGMIATFQSITLFGTGDPKLMAGGISQALITTVLGLVAAIPLLFMHNFLNTRSKEVIQVLDQQAAGLIAQKVQSK